jgi:hypothetical protein
LRKRLEYENKGKEQVQTNKKKAHTYPRGVQLGSKSWVQIERIGLCGKQKLVQITSPRERKEVRAYELPDQDWDMHTVFQDKGNLKKEESVCKGWLTPPVSALLLGGPLLKIPLQEFI